MSSSVWTNPLHLAAILAGLATASCGRLGYETSTVQEAGCHQAPCAARDAHFDDARAFDAAVAKDAFLVDVPPPPDAPAASDVSDDNPANDAGAPSDTSPVNPEAVVSLPYAQDFESDESLWGLYNGGRGTRAIATNERAHRGSRSIEVTIKNGTEVGSLEARFASTLTNGPLYSRVYLYVPSAATISNWLIPMEMKGPSELSGKFSLDMYNSTFGTHVSGAGVAASSTTIPRNTWVCVEIGIGISASQGWVRTWINGQLAQERLSINTNINDSDPGVRWVRIGIITMQPQQQTTLFFDDWALATTPIGCF